MVVGTQIATWWTVRGSNPGSPSPRTMGTGSFPWVKRPGRGVDHPPPSRAEVKETVKLYLNSPFGSTWPVLRWTLPYNTVSYLRDQIPGFVKSLHKKSTIPDGPSRRATFQIERSHGGEWWLQWSMISLVGYILMAGNYLQNTPSQPIRQLVFKWQTPHCVL